MAVGGGRGEAGERDMRSQHVWEGGETDTLSLRSVDFMMQLCDQVMRNGNDDTWLPRLSIIECPCFPPRRWRLLAIRRMLLLPRQQMLTSVV